MKRQWGQTQNVCFSFWRAGSVLCASEWVAVAWSKVSFAFSVFVMLWEGCDIQVGWSPILCVLYVDPAESHCVGGATYRPASRDRYPIPSHTRVGDRKPNLATSQLYDWAKLSGCKTKTWRVGGVKCHFCWSGGKKETVLWMCISY